MAGGVNAEDGFGFYLAGFHYGLLGLLVVLFCYHAQLLGGLLDEQLFCLELVACAV